MVCTVGWFPSYGIYTDLAFACCLHDEAKTRHIGQLLKNSAEASGDSVTKGRALWQIGASMIEAGHWREAEPPLTQSLAILEQHMGNFHLDIARVCNSLAIVYYKASQLLRSSQYFACQGLGNVSSLKNRLRKALQTFRNTEARICTRCTLRLFTMKENTIWPLGI